MDLVDFALIGLFGVMIIFILDGIHKTLIQIKSILLDRIEPRDVSHHIMDLESDSEVVNLVGGEEQ